MRGARAELLDDVLGAACTVQEVGGQGRRQGGARDEVAAEHLGSGREAQEARSPTAALLRHGEPQHAELREASAHGRSLRSRIVDERVDECVVDLLLAERVEHVRQVLEILVQRESAHSISFDEFACRPN